MIEKSIENVATTLISSVAPSSTRVVCAYGANSSPGFVRTLNEDAYLAFPEKQLFGVADGFGGNGVGDVAAKKCLEDIKSFVQQGLGDSEVTLPFIYRNYYTTGANLIFNAFLYANQQLYHQNKEHHINGRGGASAVFAFFENHYLTLAHVGLCSAILVRNKKAQHLVKPRSYNAVRGVFEGQWKPNWAFPLMALGQSLDVEPEVLELKTEPGDLILLCSDGIYPYLTEADFTSILSNQPEPTKTSKDEWINQLNQRLIDVVQQKGGQDNLAIISMLCT